MLPKSSVKVFAGLAPSAASSAFFQWTTLTVAGLPPQVVSPSSYRRPSNGSALGSLIFESVTFRPTWSKNLPRVACLPRRRRC